MPINLKWIRARLIIGFALVRYVLLLPFRSHQGPRRWLLRLAAEHIASTPRAVWHNGVMSSRCIGCGMCDGVGEIDDRPSYWLRGSSRRPEDAVTVAPHVTRLRVLAEDIARICPLGVCANEVADLIEGNAESLLRARSGL